MSTAVPCADEAGELVRQIVLDLRPMRGVAGALDDIKDWSGVSFWKLKKLWNPSLQEHGFTWKADEHRDLKAAYFKHIAEQEKVFRERLNEIHRLRSERLGQGETQLGLEI